MKSVQDLKQVEEMYNSQGYDALVRSLKSERSSLHPDKNGNKFDSNDAESRYHFLNSAIEHANELEAKSKQLIPMSEMTKLVEVMSKSIALHKEPSTKEIEITSRQNARFELSRKYKGKKIGSGVFAAFLGFLITQAPNLEKNPILKPFMSDPFFTQLMLIIGLYSAFFFVLLWVREGREESLATYMLSEAPLRKIFYLLKSNAEKNIITSHDIFEAVGKVTGNSHYSLFKVLLGGRLCASTIDQIVEIQTQRLLERKVIELIDTPSVDRTYKIVD
ncbi:MAG: hypothetical protein ACRDC6_14085 [Shewanella sp.]